jgi:hypothetical protein
MARRKGQTKSQVIREAIRVLADFQEEREGPLSPYEAIAHLIGCARGGPPDLSERSGEKFRQILRKQRRSE